MKKQEITTEKQPNEDQDQAKTKKNTYTPEENKFADGEGTKLDKAIDNDEGNPASRGI